MQSNDLPMISGPSDSTQVELAQVGPPPAPAKPLSEIRKPPVLVPRAAAPEDEDPERLLREYSDRQKTKVLRLEQKSAEYRNVAAERDGYRTKAETLSKALQEARQQLEGAEKADGIIKDLKGKIDATILSNSILVEEKDKLKRGLAQQTENLKRAEERAGQAERSLSESQKALDTQIEGRKDAESRVGAAIQALQGRPDPQIAKPAVAPARSPAVLAK